MIFSRRRVKGKISTLLLFLSSVAAAIVLVELLLRAIISVDPLRIAEERRDVYGVNRERQVNFKEGRGIGNLVLHPYLGFVAEPDTRVNSHGFLGADPLKHVDKHNFNVVIVGGSVAGNFCALDDKIRRDLSRLPSLQDRTVNVFCFAVGGYRQPQQLLTVAYFLSLGVRIDLLINLDGFNDIVLPLVHNLTYGTSLSYPIFWRDMTYSLLPPATLRALGKLEFLEDTRVRFARFFESPFASHSAIWSYTWYALDRWILGRASNARAEVEQVMRSGQSPYAQRGYRFTTDESAARLLLAEMWGRSSRSLHSLGEQYSFSYVHVLHPNQYVPDSKPLTQSEKLVAYKPEQYRLSEHVRKGYPLLLAQGNLLRKDGIRFVDASMAFSRSTEDLYIDTCCHFNMKGNEVLWLSLLQHVVREISSQQASN
jgi:hypothetical protein